MHDLLTIAALLLLIFRFHYSSTPDGTYAIKSNR